MVGASMSRLRAPFAGDWRLISEMIETPGFWSAPRKSSGGAAAAARSATTAWGVCAIRAVTSRRLLARMSSRIMVRRPQDACWRGCRGESRYGQRSLERRGDLADLLQLRPCRSRVDRLGRPLDARSDVLGEAGHHQPGPGIQQDSVSRGAMLASQDGLRHPQVGLDGATGDALQGGALQPDFFWGELVFADGAVG